MSWRHSTPSDHQAGVPSVLAHGIGIAKASGKSGALRPVMIWKGRWKRTRGVIATSWAYSWMHRRACLDLTCQTLASSAAKCRWMEVESQGLKSEREMAKDMKATRVGSRGHPPWQREDYRRQGGLCWYAREDVRRELDEHVREGPQISCRHNVVEQLVDEIPVL